VINGAGANVVGGLSLTDRNRDLGEHRLWHLHRGAAATNNVVKGNFIGVNASGIGAIANQYGIIVESAATAPPSAAPRPRRATVVSATRDGNRAPVRGNEQQPDPGELRRHRFERDRRRRQR